MISVQEAELIILNLIPALDTEIVSLESAFGRVLAKSVTSKLDFPHWDNSAMDGYAVKFADVQNCSEATPTILEIVEEIPASYQPQVSLKVGQAARIFTGAMMPEGADTIVIQEDTQREGNQVKIFSSPQPQAFVRHQGSFYQAGNPLLKPGMLIKEPELAILATAQCTSVPVYRRPRVAIFSTGDELITPDQVLQPGKIIDSNQYALAAFVTANGGIPLKMGIVPDQPEMLKKTIVQAITSADLVLSTGGVSVGDYDYVEGILAELGAEIKLSSVAIKPGKPLTVATFPNSCLYFGIPGNPVSALVSCWRFLQPALRKISGFAGNSQPSFLQVRSLQDLHSGGQRETYLWGNLSVVEGYYQFQLASGSQSSGNLINLAKTNALAVLPVGQKIVKAGEMVKVMQIS